jgi:hypothetical protein
MVCNHYISCVGHFILNEARPLFLFYIGWFGLMTSCAKFIAMETAMVDQPPEAYKHKSLPDYEGCIGADMKAAALSLTSPFEGSCVRLAWNPWGWLNYTCLVIIFFLVAVMTGHIIKLARNTKKHDKTLTYESGRFIRYTTYVQNKCWYRCFSKFFIFYTICGVLTVFYVGFRSGSWVAFLQSQAQGLVLTIWGAYQFTMLHRPAFAMQNKVFKALKFKRGFLGFVNQSNDELCKKLERALYNAQWNCTDDLKALVDFEASGIDENKISDLLHALNPDKKKGEEAATATAVAGDSYQKV